MNKIFIVTHYNLIEEEDRHIIGTFSNRLSAILFIKYLMGEGVEGDFDIDMVEPLTMDENINRYKNNKSITTAIATTLHDKVTKYGEIYLYPNKLGNGSKFKNDEIIDLFHIRSWIIEWDMELRRKDI